LHTAAAAEALSPADKTKAKNRLRVIVHMGGNGTLHVEPCVPTFLVQLLVFTHLFGAHSPCFRAFFDVPCPAIPAPWPEAQRAFRTRKALAGSPQYRLSSSSWPGSAGSACG
jgi:hypothetical protein